MFGKMLLNIIIKELAKEYGWSDEYIVRLLQSYTIRKGQKAQEQLVSYLVQAGKNEKDMKETKF